jgi:hypothetical protein
MNDQLEKVEENKKAEEANKVEETRKELVDMRAKVNEEFSNETEDFTPPIVVERINQILNDAVAGLPTKKIEPAPEVDVMERARQQIKDALANMNVSEEVASKVTGVVGEPAEKPEEKPVPVKEPAPAVAPPPAWGPTTG